MSGVCALFVGEFGAAAEALRLSSLRADVDPRLVSNIDTAKEVLSSGRSPHCMFVDASMPEFDELIDWSRGQAKLFATPIVVFVPGATAHAYAEALSLGADDMLVSGDTAGVTRRLAHLRTVDPSERPPVTQGRAIIACTDVPKRRLLGRLLRQAGFTIDFAEHGSELRKLGEQEPAPTVMVATATLPPRGPLDATMALRTRERPVPLVVLASGERLAELRKTDEPAACAGDYEAPPDHLLFLANELLRPGIKNVRASDRLLVGALTGFRAAGAFEPTYALTYNISRGGLYVRTLDPPPRGTSIWLEMRPPGRRDMVHLRATVMWRTVKAGATPPGFGVKLETAQCPKADLEEYEAAYEELRATVLHPVS